MTNSEVTAVFNQAIATSLSEMKTLPEDLAERYSSWVQQLIINAQAMQMQIEQQAAPQNAQQNIQQEAK